LEFFKSEEQDGLKDLWSQRLGLEELDGWAIDSKDSLSGANWGNSDWVFLSAEALDELGLAIWHMACN
jgi:hypothetical protein